MVNSGMMLELPRNIEALVAAEKEIAVRPKWDMESDSEHARMSAVLVIGEVAIGGLEIVGRVSQRLADRDAMFQLQYFQTGRHRIPLWRCQWRRLKPTRTGGGPQEWNLLNFAARATATHLQIITLNQNVECGPETSRQQEQLTLIRQRFPSLLPFAENALESAI